MGDLLIGIDVGTTVLKAAAFRVPGGKIAARSARRLKVTADRTGKREESPAGLLRALRSALSELASRVGRSWSGVSGVGVASQGGSMIIVDRRTGSAATPMVLWNDARAFPLFEELCRRKPVAFWRSFSARDEPGMGLARIEWLRRRRPELIDPERYLYVGAGEFVFHALTGKWRQDPCNAIQIGCYDVGRRRLTKKPLSLAGVPLSFFAPLRVGHETHPLARGAARRFGLPHGIQVAGPYLDHEAGFAAVMSASRSPLACSLGTAWVGNFTLPAGREGTSPFQLSIPDPRGTGTLVIQPLLTGNVTWDWALQTFLDSDHRRALARQRRVFARTLLPPSGLMALPWQNRPNHLSPGKVGAAAFFGLGPATTPEDLVRAVAAGMALEFERVFEDVVRRGLTDSVVLSGGASRAAVFRRLLSALFRPAPVFVVTEEDWMGARGSLYAFDERVCAARVEAVKEKDAAVEKCVLDECRALYRDLFKRLYGEVAAGGAFRVRGGRRRRSSSDSSSRL